VIHFPLLLLLLLLHHHHHHHHHLLLHHPSSSQAFSIYTIAFVLGLYSNMRALEKSNVETIILFRSATPLAVSLCDFLFMGRELPSWRSIGALLAIALGR